MAASVEEAQGFKAKGNAAFQQGNYEEAIKFFSLAIKLTPEDAVLYSNRSGAWASMNKFEEALKDADMCVKLKPDWGKAYSRKGLAEYRLMKFKEAEATYRKGVQVDPTNDQLKEGLRQIGEQIDQIASVQAMIAASQAIQKHKKLARYQQEDKEYTRRLTDILKEIQRNPQSLKLVMAQPDLRIKEGVIAAMGGDLEEEEESSCTPSQQQRQNHGKSSTSTSSSFSSSSSSSSSRSGGTSGVEKNDPSQGQQKEITEEEKRAEKLKEEGNILYKGKKFEEALAAYDAAISVYPKEILYYNNKAAVYMEMGEYEKCIAECKTALEKRYECKADFSKVAKVYCRMAACYVRMEKYEEAIGAYERALTEENTRSTRNALNELKKLKERKEKEAYINPELAEEHREKGNIAFKAGDFPTAKKEYDEAIRRNPRSAVLYNNRAAALTKLFEYPSALKDADMSVELDPQYVKGWARKGNLHMLLKEFPKALQAYEKGLLIDPHNEECLQGKAQVIIKVQHLQSTGEVDPEQMAHSLADPEIQSILKDPQMNIVLANIQEKPELIHEYMRDPKIKDGITKLITAGILRVA